MSSRNGDRWRHSCSAAMAGAIMLMSVLSRAGDTPASTEGDVRVIMSPDAVRGSVVEIDSAPLAVEAGVGRRKIALGRHELRARALDHRTFVLPFEVRNASGETVVFVPPLTRAPRHLDGVGRAGIVLAIAGALALSAGAALASVAGSRGTASEGRCDVSGHCTQDGLDARQDSLRWADASTVAVIAGCALLGAGALMVVFGRSSDVTPAVQRSP